MQKLNTRLLAGLAMTSLLSVAPGVGADNERHQFKARLQGFNEVPPVVTDTSGRFRLQLNKAETEAEFTLTVNDGVRITQSHLHCAPAGVNGPVFVFLAGLHAAGLNVDGKWISNATFTNTSIVNTACGATVSAIAQSMRDGNVYVNVHSVAFPGGVIRAQLRADDDDD